MRAIVISEAGGPEVLRPQERPVPRPGPGEIRVTVHAAGVNFVDTGTRRWARADVPGIEGSGVVEQTGEGVRGFSPGDRVAWMSMTQGSYAEQVVVPAGAVALLPDGVDDETAASVLVHGVTAHMFTTVSHAVSPGEVAVVHAAAGGLGRMLTQFVKARGGTVIGLVSGPEKLQMARDAGADHALVSTGEAFREPVLELTGGEGAHVVYDAGGPATFQASMDVLRTHGTLVFYGVLVGDPPSIRMDQIPRSIHITYPNTEDHVRTSELFTSHTGEIFSLVEKGELTVRVGGRYPLAEAARAHADIESRRTTGKLLLIP